MSTPIIDSRTTLAKWIARTLQTDVKTLDKVDGEKDRAINLWSLYRSKAFKDRIIKGRGYGNCENAWFIDNGDKKVGENDLFLHFDGFYSLRMPSGKATRTFGFRWTRLFRKIRKTRKMGYEARFISALTPGAQKIKITVEKYKGRSFKKIEAALKSLPGCK